VLSVFSVVKGFGFDFLPVSGIAVLRVLGLLISAISAAKGFRI
jgi:hypothetical protein